MNSPHTPTKPAASGNIVILEPSDRAALINRILDAADRSKRHHLGAIVERFETLASNGKWYGLGWPMGVTFTDQRRGYWVFRANDGTTYGKRYATQAEAQTAFEAFVSDARSRFKYELDGMSQCRLDSQADYWLNL